MATLSRILILVICVLFVRCAYGNNDYRPALGDKFNYKISKSGGKSFTASFVFDLINKTPSFHFKWGTENSRWGTWTESKESHPTLLKEPRDSNFSKQCMLLYVDLDLFRLIKSGKKFKLFIDYEEIEFGPSKVQNFKLPIAGAELNTKILTASTSDQKWILSILDNESFPLITSLLGNTSWQLQSIVPFPMYPITHNLIGEGINAKKAELLKAYINETCVIVEARYSHNFNKVNFSEYFCPTVGIRLSLKNDSIVSLKLVSKGHRSDGYTWQTYRGCVLGIYGLGDKQKDIEKTFGAPNSSIAGRHHYSTYRLSLFYNTQGQLEMVDYE